MKLKSPQQKGKRFEYHIRDLIRGYGFDCQRSPMSGAIHFLKGDLLSKDFPYFSELKNTEKTDFIGWYKKANDQSGSKPPIIIWTKNREEPYCFLLFSDFMNLLTGGITIKQKIKKPEKTKKLSLDETSNLKFSKKHQVRRKNENHK